MNGMFDSNEPEIRYQQRSVKTIHRVMPIEPLLVEYTDRDGSTETRIVLKAGDQMVFIDQNVVATNAFPWFIKGVKKALGEE